MNPGLGRKRVAAIGQRSVAKFLEAVHRRKFGLKTLLQIAFCVGGHLLLCQIKAETSQRCYDDHHGGKQLSAKARDAFVSRLLRGTHGKSTWSVWPLFNSTGFSRVVLLSIHALSV